VRDVERSQPKAGRLDLLLREPETGKRYEVELMLGALDESHIIRTIEYWDIERKRYPQYDHCAVIVAEEITSRFLNVIGLFNSVIPFIAIQLNALQVGEQIVLHFAKVLDEISLGIEEEDDDGGKPTDRSYWEPKSSPLGMSLLDENLQILKEIDPALELNYTRSYIGLKHHGKVENFILFWPKKKHIQTFVEKEKEQPVWRSRLEEAGIAVLERKERKRIMLHLKKDDLDQNREVLKELYEVAYQEWFE
jgi:hypothetical protein